MLCSALQIGMTCADMLSPNFTCFTLHAAASPQTELLQEPEAFHWRPFMKKVMLLAGSEKDAEHYGASSSDSEEEALVEMQSTGRKPSTNYRPEFAAKTLAQASQACCFIPSHALTLSLFSAFVDSSTQ